MHYIYMSGSMFFSFIIAVCIVNKSDGTGTVLYSTLVSFSVKSRD